MGALSNIGGRGERNREEIGVGLDKTAMLRRLTKGLLSYLLKYAQEPLF